MSISTAVVPAAGLGTRFLPATKVVPKELLPVVDIPAIQYVVQEAADAGLTDVVIVVGPGKGSVMEHFAPNPRLEAVLAARDDPRQAAIQALPGLANLRAVTQAEPRGLGHAIACTRAVVGHKPFAVLLGDDLIDPRDPLLTSMIALHEVVGGSVVGLMEMPRQMIGLYGSARAEAVDPAVAQAAGLAAADVVRLHDLVEKPDPAEAPSNLAIIGRYVLSPAVFDVLQHQAPGRGGEIQLTDALASLAEMPTQEGGGVHGVIFRGRRYDTGDRLDYLKTVVRLAAERPDLGPDFRAWLLDFVSQDGASRPKLFSQPISGLVPAGADDADDAAATPTPDAGLLDSGLKDGSPDAGLPDAGVLGGSPDVGLLDSGFLGGPPDAAERGVFGNA